MLAALAGLGSTDLALEAVGGSGITKWLCVGVGNVVFLDHLCSGGGVH